MSGTLKRVDSGWLARSVEDAKHTDANTRSWIVKVRSNWIDSVDGKADETQKNNSDPK